MSKLIEAADVCKSFNTEAGELSILRGINLSVIEGEMVSITGASGAGKSTLMHILGALDRPTSGTVRFKGSDVFSLDDTSLARFRNGSIGFVFQFHHLLPEFNALENAMLPGLISNRPYEEAEQKARKLLEELGLSKRLLHRPGELSGGEQQRVAVARALMQDSGLVLADEPTGNLDPETSQQIIAFLTEINQEGRTVVMVTHDPNAAGKAKRTLRLEAGRILNGRIP